MNLHMFKIDENKVNPLHPQLLEKLSQYDNTRNFQPDIFTEKRCQEFLNYMKKHNLKSAVVSVSGGIDSAVVYSLLLKAQEMADETHPFHIKNGGKVIGIAQPIFSTPEIQKRAFELAEKRGTNLIIIDQTEEHQTLIKKIEEQTGELHGFSKSMFKSYQRTPTAFLLASNYNGVVVGTGNLDEDGYLYYYCKFGDGAVDLGLIWDLHKSEVYSVGKYLDVPESILIAPPSADLACGQTDETEMGVTYDMVRLVYSMLNKIDTDDYKEWLNSLCESARDQYIKEKNIIDTIHNKGLHKADLNPVCIGK